MSEPNTTMGLGGGAGGQFPQTTWGLVAKLQGETDRRAGLEVLCTRYWRPIYGYLRGALGRRNEDAKDLTQAFLTWLLEGEVLARYAPEEATFRAYLKGLLRHFVSNHDQSLRRLKRGGGARHVSFPGTDEAVGSLEDLLADPRGVDPEEAFERAWVAGLIERAVERTCDELRAEGHDLRLRVYEAYELGPPGAQPTYSSVAAELGIKQSDVRNHLFAARERVRAAIREELRDTVGSVEQLEQEWGALFT